MKDTYNNKSDQENIQGASALDTVFHDKPVKWVPHLWLIFEAVFRALPCHPDEFLDRIHGRVDET